MRFLAGVATTLLVLAVFAAGGLAAIWWGGFYNVAATDPHFDPVGWALDTTMENSVERRADTSSPASFTDEDLRKGFSSFDAMCKQCHGAPGVQREPWAEGLRPSPPELSEKALTWSTAELFWIVKHGIKMTGMPALAPSHDDSEIWPIIAFVERLPEITAEEYAALSESISAGHHAGAGEPPHARGKAEAHGDTSRGPGETRETAGPSAGNQGTEPGASGTTDGHGAGQKTDTGDARRVSGDETKHQPANADGHHAETGRDPQAGHEGAHDDSSQGPGETGD